MSLRPILSLLIWAAIAVIGLLWLPLLVVVYVTTVPFDPGRYAVGRWLRRAAIVAVAINPLWRFRTSGVRIEDPRRPYVAVSNHESYADIFLISHLPWEMKWLSKEEILWIPIVGWMMRMAGDIGVRRHDAGSRTRALAACRDRLEKKVSVMIMPEGTRSPDGEMLPFLDGAFELAVSTGCPILPLVVAGTRDAMPKGSFSFNRTVAEVRVLEPIETAGLTPVDVPALRDQTRARIAAAKQELLVSGRVKR
jgi:1-acyl-sn-glycerol-3-phosphate acyltransferase